MKIKLRSGKMSAIPVPPASSIMMDSLQPGPFNKYNSVLRIEVSRSFVRMSLPELQNWTSMWLFPLGNHVVVVIRFTIAISLSIEYLVDISVGSIRTFVYLSDHHHERFLNTCMCLSTSSGAQFFHLACISRHFSMTNVHFGAFEDLHIILNKV